MNHRLGSRSSTVTLISVMSCFLFGAPAFAAADLMPLGEAVIPPFGFIDFCRREPQECVSNEPGAGAASANDMPSRFWSFFFAMSARPKPIVKGLEAAVENDASASLQDQDRPLIMVSDKNWNRIYGINRAVNSAIRPVSDLDLYGSEGVWSLPLERGGRRKGDCKDYVVEKRHLMINAGYDPRALSIALVETHSGTRHAVLLVATDRGELVLDNLNSWIVRWNQTDYRWVSRQSPLDPLSWMTAINYNAAKDAPGVASKS